MAVSVLLLGRVVARSYRKRTFTASWQFADRGETKLPGRGGMCHDGRTHGKLVLCRQ